MTIVVGGGISNYACARYVLYISVQSLRVVFILAALPSYQVLKTRYMF